MRPRACGHSRVRAVAYACVRSLTLACGRACVRETQSGYDDLEYLVSMDNEQTLRCCTDVGFKASHAAKFRDYLIKAAQGL